MSPFSSIALWAESSICLTLDTCDNNFSGSGSQKSFCRALRNNHLSNFDPSRQENHKIREIELKELKLPGQKFTCQWKPGFHTCAKMIEIQKIYLQKIHGIHELGSRMECNDTLHGSELGPHWVLGPKNSKFGPMGPKFLAQKFLYTKSFRYHGAIL